MTIARGNVRPGSRTSPEILLTSHQPPNEKKAPTIAAPSAGINGSDPVLCATKGAKFDHDPSRSENPQTTRNASRPNLSHVLQRKTAALTWMLRIFSVQSNQITPIPTAFAAIEFKGKMKAQ